MSRWKAAFIHLLISALVVGSVAAVIIWLWYPPALMPMAKADRLLMLIGGVDLVAGPLLTLIVYKAGKPKLKMDLTIIALMQFLFLSYGLYTIWDSRPVFLVAVPDRFELVFANEISDKRLSEAKLKQFRHLGFGKPVLVGTLFPTDIKEQQQILFSAIAKQGDIQQMPKHYVEYADVKTGLMKFAKRLDDTALNKSEAQALENAAKDYGFAAKDLRYLHLGSSRGYAVMLVRADTAEPVGPVNIDP